MSSVFVLDTKKRPLDPIHPGRARTLLAEGKAAVLKRYPFTIILKVGIEKPEVHPLRIKVDPGSQTTGIALVNDTTGEVVFAAELSHRGDAIKKSLDQRRAVRRGRRQRRTRYRQPRFANRKRRAGWMAPSLESRVVNVLTWVKRLSRLCLISAISLELVRSTPSSLKIAGIIPLLITATEHGNRQKCNVDEIGFPCSKPKGAKKVKGYQTGDMVRAVVTTGTKQGVYVGRVLIRASGFFDIRTKQGRVQGLSHRFCTSVHRCDGYSYQKEVPLADHPTQSTR